MEDRIDDGFSTILEFADFPAVDFQEIDVTPPGMSGGGGIDVTNMRNLVVRTMSPKQLKSMTAITFTAAYKASVYTTCWEMLQQNQLITLTFPHDETLQVWGFLDDFTPGSHSEGQRPTASVTIILSNHDNDYNEVEPVYAAA